MARRESEEIERIHLHLFTSDIELLKELYSGSGQVGFNKAVRLIVRSGCKRIRERQSELLGRNTLSMDKAMELIGEEHE